MNIEKEHNKENLSPFKINEKVVVSIDNRSCTKPNTRVRFTIDLTLFVYRFLLSW